MGDRISRFALCGCDDDDDDLIFGKVDRERKLGGRNDRGNCGS
jgi:hypothetical protein